jgi:multidrug efflux pump subunit AcrA (membrane-fusion protein)
MRIVSFFFIVLSFPLHAKPAESQTDQSSEPPEVFVQVLREEELYNPLSFGGFVDAITKRPVGAELTGTVNKMNVRLGQVVKRGQLLFNLRPQGAGLEYRLNSILSPIDGVVTEIVHNPGEFVQAGENVVVVADERQLQVEVHVTYDDLDIIKVGGDASVVVASPERTDISAPGKVVSVSPAAHPDIGTFPVEIAIQCVPNCEQQYRIGTFVRAIFKTNLHRGIKVDAKYLVNQRKKAIIVDKGSTAKMVDVRIGNFLGTEVEILSGLRAGDKLITNYSKFPKESEKVIVKHKDREKEKIYSGDSKKKPIGKS